MQDRAVVAAIIAGDADSFAAAYDQYAASLYACCHTVLPEPEAAEAVLDTFLVAAAKLDGLRDPDRLGPWLHAVARNECLRRLGPGGEIPALADQGAEPPEVPLPPGFRNRVLTACADNSPAGRAHRMSVAHRAGVFGPAGFPKGIGPSGPSWWRGVRRHPGAVAAVAAVAVVAAVGVAAGITVAMTAGASHRPQASGPGLGGGMPAPASSTTPGTTSGAPTPARTAPASVRPTSPPVSAGATSAGPSPGRSAPESSASPSPSTLPSASPSPSTSPSASRSPSTSPSASRSPSRSPSTSPSASTSPAPGHLLVAPGKLMLTSVSGKPASGSFVLTAANGPVLHYTVGVAVMASNVKVAPAAGSLQVNGKVKVTVTVTSKVALTTDVIVKPGNLTVTVVYKPQPQPSPST